jgi:hypothetical protein
VRLNDADPKGIDHGPPIARMLERIVMNAKFLFATTVGLALASSWALADDAATTRAAVIAETQQAARAGKLHRTDYDDELASRPAPGSNASREEVVATLKARADARLVGPLRSRNYNPYGTETMRAPIYNRADVKADVLEARAAHTLRPAGEAGDLAVGPAPRRELPAFLATRRQSSGG